MDSNNPRATVLALMDQLNKSMPELRKQWSTVIGLKNEIEAANVRISAADPKLGQAEFSRLVERYLDAW